MNEERHVRNQITEGVIWKQLLLFFFPIVLGTFFQQIYNTADAMIVGRFVGKEALGSVGGSSGQIIMLIVGFFVGLSSGATVIISQFYGAKDEKNINYALHTAIAFSLVGSACITAFGILASPALLRMMHTPTELMAGSILYLRIYFAGIVFVFIFNVGSAILRAAGDSKRPLYYLILCCFINIFLDILFVPVLRLGVAGVALGTFLSQGVSAVFVLRALARSQDIYRLRLRELRFYRSALRSLLRIGIPAGLQSVMYNVSNTIMQAYINSFGTDTVAAYTAYGKVDNLYWMAVNAFGISIATFVGQNYGAGKYGRIRRSVAVSFGMGMSFSVVLSAVLILGGSGLLHLFTGDPEVVGIGTSMIRFLMPFYSVYVIIEILSSTLRGMGDVLLPTMIVCGGVCVLRVVWVASMFPRYSEIKTVLLSYPISWSVTAVLFVLYYLHRKRKWPAQ